MTKTDRKILAALDRQASRLQKVWLSELESQRRIRITANAEVRRRWIDSDSIESMASSAAEVGKETGHDSRDSSG